MSETAGDMAECSRCGAKFAREGRWRLCPSCFEQMVTARAEKRVYLPTAAEIRAAARECRRARFRRQPAPDQGGGRHERVAEQTIAYCPVCRARITTRRCLACEARAWRRERGLSDR
jgi:Zn finger protein HypA/HybF involved in hydrogenase expression